jgi:hypothetical protein
VHTFVPGLPLTFLEYNLVTGDSLAGIGTLDEVTDILDMEQSSLEMFMGGQSVMDEVHDDIAHLGDFADASAEQVQEARETRAQIEESLEQVRARFDILAASRIDDEVDTGKVSDTSVGDITKLQSYGLAKQVLSSTNPIHFPAAFPEVFEGKNAGFDVTIGNPPWEEEQLDKDNFWRRYEPGLKGKSKREKVDRIEELENARPDLAAAYELEWEEKRKRREILTSGPYPGIGTGDPDTYKAFCWRFWHLIDTGGSIGVVLPRSAFLSAGTEGFRRTILDEGRIEDLTFLKNKRGWVFEQAHHQYTIALASITRADSDSAETIPLRGPYSSAEIYEEGMGKNPHYFPVEQAKNWTDTAAFPLLPEDPRSVSVFDQLTAAPRLDTDSLQSWRVRPNRELDATLDKKSDDGITLMHFVENPPDSYWPVYKGNSFNIWNPDTGVRYAWADPKIIVDYLQKSRENSYRYAGSRSAFADFTQKWVHDPKTLPCLRYRVAFRNVTNRTNRRTIICSLVPPKTILTNAAPYFLWPRGDEKDQAYLLGVLSSIPLDWYARRFVESNVNYHIINAFPIPRPGQDSPLRQRVVELSGRLAAIDQRFKNWSDAVGVSFGPLDDDIKNDMISELDAIVAHLYNLSREHVNIIFQTFHNGWDYQQRIDAVLRYYDEWE